jgi:hypothetical protein
LTPLVSRLPLATAALQGEPMSGQYGAISQLRRVLRRCTAQGLFEESIFVHDVLDSLRSAYRSPAASASSTSQGERRDAAADELADREQIFAHAQAALDADEFLACQGVEQRFQDELAALEEEWATERKQGLFNKPSPALIVMRATAKRMLASHRFDDAAQVAAQIEEKEREDAEAASRRMAEAYQTAAGNLRAHFDGEKAAISLAFQEKRVALARKKDQQIGPIQKRIANLETQKPQSKVPGIRATGRRAPGSFKISIPPMNLGNQKLILRPVPAGAGRKVALK